MENKKNIDVWGWIGRIGAIVGIIWGGIQIYTYTIKTDDYDAEAKGLHSFYETSPKYKNAYQKVKDYKALVKSIVSNEGSLKNHELDTLLAKIKKENKSSELRKDFEFYSLIENRYEDNDSEIWSFSIKNKGIKPFEELALELPFEGTYKVIYPDNYIKEGEFKNKIDIGELRPSYEVKVVCWVESVHSYISFRSIQNEEKSRFTHKYGWFSIEYPIEIEKGFISFNQKYDYFPLVLMITLISIITYILGIYSKVDNKSKK